MGGGRLTGRELLGRLDELPRAKRQPNLLFAAARHAGARPGCFTSFRATLLASWLEVRAIIMSKRTQTNEPGHCAVLQSLLRSPGPSRLLTVLAQDGQPVAYAAPHGQYLHWLAGAGPAAR